jgi:pyruvate dehydrogenase E2 component (dihydrolipoamide acetyltransferase)
MAQETGILVRWLKQEGDEITKGEPLMEIETDKVTVEIEAPASGILANVAAAPGDEIPVGQVIALILAPGEAAPERLPPTVEPVAAPTPPQQPAPSPSAPTPVTSAGSPVASPLAARIAAEHGVDLARIKTESGRVEKSDVLAFVATRGKTVSASAGVGGNGARLTLASPKARRLAQERDLSITAIPGTGPDGAVLAADVLNFTPAVAPAATTSGDQTLALSTVWRVMAERLTHSWTNTPHFYLMRDANVSRFVAWHQSAQAKSEEKLTYTDLLVKLVAVSLREHPRVNARWDDDVITLIGEVNVGLAVAVEEGLIVPVIHGADQLSLSEIAQRRLELVDRARNGGLHPDDMQGGTFTISNLGMYGVDVFSAIVNPPQAAILAVGRIADRVVPVDGQPAVQPMMMLSLSFDHRVVDGARGAQFLQTLADLIEEPLGLLT